MSACRPCLRHTNLKPHPFLVFSCEKVQAHTKAFVFLGSGRSQVVKQEAVHHSCATLQPLSRRTLLLLLLPRGCVSPGILMQPSRPKGPSRRSLLQRTSSRLARTRPCDRSCLSVASKHRVIRFSLFLDLIHSARSVAASYKPPMLVTRVRLPACALKQLWSDFGILFLKGLEAFRGFEYVYKTLYDTVNLQRKGSPYCSESACCTGRRKPDSLEDS